MELRDAMALEVGQLYQFKIFDWETPLGGVIAGREKRRTFLDVDLRGAEGQAKEPFIRVARADGSTHLIHIETIESCEACNAA
ncbi:hypothetical protein [Castellaniella sp.]|uniref:hypothetical protein n=1 Tax=Castellaniella sp. TaxID=1955812 RepID=UPI002AFE71B2|nr:hypothetical protein [Castellaniella sp.]